jgi:hypothetical protein
MTSLIEAEAVAFFYATLGVFPLFWAISKVYDHDDRPHWRHVFGWLFLWILWLPLGLVLLGVTHLHNRSRATAPRYPQR